MTAVTPAAVEAEDPEVSPAATRGRGGGRGRGRGASREARRIRRQNEREQGKLPAWQIIQTKKQRICPTYNLGLCTNTSETCSREHKCSRQTGATMLCYGGHPEVECTAAVSA